MKNMASIDDKKGGSWKMIPISSANETEPAYNTKKASNTVVSIPVP